MKNIDVRGTICSNDEKEIYEWLGIEATAPKDVNKALIEADGDDITVLVNSGGGDLMAGNEMYSLLKRYEGATTAEITGFAASAATLVCCGADKCVANPGIQYMIHNVSSIMGGDHRDMETMAEVLQTADVSIANIYRLKTGLTEKELLKMMSHGTQNNGLWMDAKKAKEYGFVDEIKGDDGSLAGPITIYNSLFATVLNEEMKERFREAKLGNEKAELKKQQLARLALLKLKGGMRNV